MIAPFNYFAVAGASILFFMISGALVLYNPKAIIPFLKKRLFRVVLPMVIWTIVSLLIAVCCDDFPWHDVWRKVLMIPFAPQEGTYWFIYVVFGIYMLTPILAVWLERCSKHDLQFYLAVWGVSLMLPYLRLLYGGFDAVVGVDSGFLYYFSGYLWFAVMGYYIRRYVDLPRFCWWHYVLAVGLVLLPVLLYMTDIPHAVIQDRLSVNVVALCICYFVALKHINYTETTKMIVYDFAQHSFGIYLVHIHVMRRILWPLIAPLDLHYALSIPIVVLLTAAISYILVHAISKLPYSKYIVGL